MKYDYSGPWHHVTIYPNAVVADADKAAAEAAPVAPKRKPAAPLTPYAAKLLAASRANSAVAEKPEAVESVFEGVLVAGATIELPEDLPIVQAWVERGWLKPAAATVTTQTAPTGAAAASDETPTEPAAPEPSAAPAEPPADPAASPAS